MIKLSTYLRQYKVGDIVDVKANGAVQKGSEAYPLMTLPTTHSYILQDAPQSLPWENRGDLQCHQERRGRHHLQAGRESIYRETG